MQVIYCIFTYYVRISTVYITRLSLHLLHKVAHVGSLIRIGLSASQSKFTEEFLLLVGPVSNSCFSGLEIVLVNELTNTHLKEKDAKTVNVHLWTLLPWVKCFRS